MLTSHSAASRRSQTEQRGAALGAGLWGQAPETLLQSAPTADVQTRGEGVRRGPTGGGGLRGNRIQCP